MKETKTVQVYPDDDIVNDTIGEYESFGWEVVGNQRCQEYEGQTHDIITGSSTKHYSTFNKITFTREKDAQWYDEVSQIEREYTVLKDTVKNYKNCKPVLKTPQPDGVVVVALGFMCYCFWIIPGVIYTIVRASKKSKYKKEYEKELADYKAVYPAKIKELNEKTAELRARAEKLVSGKAA
ncbi:MAG: hypothetical protein HDP34_03140 [Clostridia bacterium]|nr:hypothetical protein [Clostridia bacterium]